MSTVHGKVVFFSEERCMRQPNFCALAMLGWKWCWRCCPPCPSNAQVGSLTVPTFEPACRTGRGSRTTHKNISAWGGVGRCGDA